MFSFLIAVFVIFLLVQLFKVIFPIYSRIRQMRNFMNNPYDYFAGQAGAQRSQAEHTQPKKHKKKFGKDVGEYVEFEEIATETAAKDKASGNTSVRYSKEEQVTDIKWEDL